MTIVDGVVDLGGDSCLDSAMVVFLRFFISGLVALFGAGLSVAHPPHIILIMADDIGVEGIGAYGGESYRTPRINEMASSGLKFTRAYSQPLCTPTRVQIMTGKYNHRNWLYFGCLDPEEKTFGHYLQDAGYKTSIVGKWQLYSYDPPHYPGAAQRRSRGMHPSEAGFDDWFLFHAEHTEDKGSRYADPTMLDNGRLVTGVEGDYGEDLSVERALEFLAENSESPCFVYYPMALPHWPMVPTPISEAWSDPERRLEEDVSFFPDMVEYMDLLVGRVIDGVEQQGLAEQTLILFYSDNGTDVRITSRQNGVEVPGGKGKTTQNGIHVPLVAYWPGTIEPGECDDLVDASDFLPTLLELVGARPPQEIDGVSFYPQLLGKENPDAREWAFFWYDPRPGWDKDQFSRSVFAVDESYKLYTDGRFFNIVDDPLEKKPLRYWDTGSRGLESLNRLRGAIESQLEPLD